MSWKDRTRRRASRQLDDGEHLSVPAAFSTSAELAHRYVVTQRNWYRHRSVNVRRLFRSFGVGAIILSSSVPVITFIQFDGFRLVITILGVAITALTALRTFFRWDEQWQVLKLADWHLTALLADWEAKMCVLDPASQGSLAAAGALTERLLTDAKDVVEREAVSFFAGVRWPDTGANERRDGATVPSGSEEQDGTA